MIKENKYFLVEDFIEYDSPADDRGQSGGVGRYLQTNKQIRKRPTLTLFHSV